ncbi:MAG TPA: GNAT family N-acetyltransferase [Bacillota bacterium]|nr:GNAT family N-acetyltransferase [Bacillota bacterium]
MHIREIEEKDNAIMAEIIKQSLESLGLDIPGTAYFDPELNRLAQFYQGETNAAYFVAVNEVNHIVGGVGIAPFDKEKGICELQKLYVIPEEQGKGFAKKLMKAALDFAKSHYTHCYLETTTQLKAATGLYLALGFQPLDQPLGQSGHDAMDTWLIKKMSD